MKLKPHRYFQLLGLYGIVFLIPVLQYEINTLSSLEEDYKRKQTQAVAQQVYEDVKKLTCELLGQQATTHDCEKGVYQDLVLSAAIDAERRINESKSNLLPLYWRIYYLFAIFGFIGNYIEYRKEYNQLD